MVMVDITILNLEYFQSISSFEIHSWFPFFLTMLKFGESFFNKLWKLSSFGKIVLLGVVQFHNAFSIPSLGTLWPDLTCRRFVLWWSGSWIFDVRLSLCDQPFSKLVRFQTTWHLNHQFYQGHSRIDSFCPHRFLNSLWAHNYQRRFTPLQAGWIFFHLWMTDSVILWVIDAVQQKKKDLQKPSWERSHIPSTNSPFESSMIFPPRWVPLVFVLPGVVARSLVLNWYLRCRVKGDHGEGGELRRIRLASFSF